LPAVHIPSGLTRWALLTEKTRTGNILSSSTAAPSLQEKQKEVSLKNAQFPGTELRAETEELTSRAPFFFSVPQLEKHMRADSLNEKISHRPSPDELIKDGVLKDDPRSADEKYDEAIEDEYAKREGGA
jgi:hypothetical protein